MHPEESWVILTSLADSRQWIGLSSSIARAELMLHFSLTSKDRDKKASLHTSNPARQWKMMRSLFEEKNKNAENFCNKASLWQNFLRLQLMPKALVPNAFFQRNNCRNSGAQLRQGFFYRFAAAKEKRRGSGEIPGENYFSAACHSSIVIIAEWNSFQLSAFMIKYPSWQRYNNAVMVRAVVSLHLFKPEIWLKRRNLIVTAPQRCQSFCHRIKSERS